jgi:hypothetical protein
VAVLGGLVSPTRAELAFAAVMALVFGAAPTVGDVGSCGDTATSLDLKTFIAERKTLDCRRCTQCDLTSQTCMAACNPQSPGSSYGWPSTCFPVQHDGVVCLDALEAASCGDYASYVSDTEPSEPSECDFCRDIPEAAAPAGDL